MKSTIQQLMLKARQAHFVIPAFNVPYLPMVEPVVRALRDTRSFGLIQVARLEWIKFEAQNLQAVRDEYEQHQDRRHTRLHLDHVPVIDEDGQRVDVEPIFREAIRLGYDSIMIDGSRLPLADNIAATKWIADLAHAAGRAIEGELGAVLGHESGPLPPYEELFRSGKGFTDPEEAARFVRETGVDWLSVAIGNIHGAITMAARTQKKLEARLNIDHLDRIRQQAKVPLVLHGGTGITRDCLREAIRHGIAKINIGTGIRQPYEALCHRSIDEARELVYKTTVSLITDELDIRDTALRLGTMDNSG